MKNDIISERWALTLLYMFMLGLGTFLVCLLLAMFVDPNLNEADRGGVVFAWTVVSFFTQPFVLIHRHG